MNKVQLIISPIFRKSIIFKTPVLSRYNKVCLQSVFNYSKDTVAGPNIEKKITSQDKWRTIYGFPYIKLAAAVAKFRKLQYIITIVGPAVTYAFEYLALVPASSTLLVLSFCVTGSITLTLCGIMLRNLVGFLYIDPSKEHLRIGYLTFRGSREDVVWKIEEIKPFSETDRFKFQPVKIISLYNDKRMYKVIDMGGVIHRDDYELIFGKN